MTVGPGIASVDNANLPAVADLTALRAVVGGFVSTVYLQGYGGADGYGAGFWVWDATSSDKDNGGTIVAPAAGGVGRWKRAYSDAVDVTWFGARGDGVTPLQAAKFNAAINYVAGTLGGGTVFVPKGVYIVTGDLSKEDSIQLRHKVKLVFEPGCTITVGAGAVVTFDGSADGSVCKPVGIDANCLQLIISNKYEEHASDIVIEGNGLIMVGSKEHFLTRAFVNISISTGHRPCTLQRVHISDVNMYCAASSAIHISSEHGTAPEWLVIERCTTNDCARNGGAIISGKHVTWRDCWFNNTNNACPLNAEGPDTGFDVEPNKDKGGLQQRVEDARFINCRFTNNQGSGLVVSPGAARNHNTQRVIIDNCFFENNGAAGLNCIGAEHITVTNCFSRNNGSFGYHLSGSKTLRVSNCYASDNGGRPTKPAEPPQFRVVNQDAAVLTNCTARNGQYSGFQADGFAGNRGVIEFNGCHSLDNAVRGFHILWAENVLVHNCYVQGNGDAGIELKGSTHCTISGNYISENGQAADIKACNLLLNADCHFNSIVGNTVRQSNSFFIGQAVKAGAASDGTDAYVILPAHANALSDDFYNGMTLRIKSGTGAGQTYTVADYIAATKRLAINSSTWKTIPDHSSIVELGPAARPRYGIRLNPGATDNSVVGNDCYHGGAEQGYSDEGVCTRGWGNRSC